MVRLALAVGAAVTVDDAAGLLAYGGCWDDLESVLVCTRLLVDAGLDAGDILAVLDESEKDGDDRPEALRALLVELHLR
ncbi:hypothetical protein DFJ73DRAFT_876236 [Zopfochytrium polystomum]|nr:hypothetical protein DFJ73DRAFT_876236 [Zopfochytrium polystomum]